MANLKLSFSYTGSKHFVLSDPVGLIKIGGVTPTGNFCSFIDSDRKGFTLIPNSGETSMSGSISVSFVVGNSYEYTSRKGNTKIYKYQRISTGSYDIVGTEKVQPLCFYNPTSSALTINLIAGDSSTADSSYKTYYYVCTNSTLTESMTAATMASIGRGVTKTITVPAGKYVNVCLYNNIGSSYNTFYWSRDYSSTTAYASSSCARKFEVPSGIKVYGNPMTYMAYGETSVKKIPANKITRCFAGFLFSGSNGADFSELELPVATVKDQYTYMFSSSTNIKVPEVNISGGNILDNAYYNFCKYSTINGDLVLKVKGSSLYNKAFYGYGGSTINGKVVFETDNNNIGVSSGEYIFGSMFYNSTITGGVDVKLGKSVGNYFYYEAFSKSKITGASNVEFLSETYLQQSALEGLFSYATINTSLSLLFCASTTGDISTFAKSFQGVSNLEMSFKEGSNPGFKVNCKGGSYTSTDKGTYYWTFRSAVFKTQPVFPDGFRLQGLTGISNSYYKTNGYEFCGMFSFSNIVDASKITISNYAAYTNYYLFYGDEDLVKAPSIEIKLDDYENKYKEVFPYCFSDAFGGCTSLTEVKFIDDADDTSNIIPYNYSFFGMFKGCTSLVSITVNNSKTLKFNIGSISESQLKSMFYGCTSLRSPGITLIKDTAGSCCKEMFSGCTSLVDMSGLTLEPGYSMESYAYGNMFYGCTNLTKPATLNCTKGESMCTVKNYSMYFMLYNTKVSSVYDFTGFSTSSSYTYQFSGMYYGTLITSTPDLSKFTSIGEYTYSNMFHGCYKLTTVSALPATTIPAYAYSNMFNGCTSLVYGPSLSHITSVGSNGCKCMFSGCSKLTMLKVGYPDQSIVKTYIGPTGGVPTAGSMSNMFYGCTSLETAYVNWNAYSHNSEMFKSSGLKTLFMTEVPDVSGGLVMSYSLGWLPDTTGTLWVSSDCANGGDTYLKSYFNLPSTWSIRSY